jgi:2,5-diamino-6-(ribosylamino)-4(3H)-pyrimidinone 5'-phosphate reductase
MTRPHVVVHVAVSLDGATTGFTPDAGRFYGLLPTWQEDVTLVGADTILAQEEALASAPMPGPTAGAPLLAVVDSRRRVSRWDALRDVGHWSGVLAVRAQPGGPDEPGVVRVDSGGALIGALLRDGLVDELSLLVHPVVAGADGDRHWWGAEPPPRLELAQVAAETTPDGVTWLRYRRP